MTEPNETKECLGTPEEVLIAFTSLLGMHFVQGDSSEARFFHEKGALDWTGIPWEPCKNDDEEDVPEVDFSSFPSLSLERPLGSEFDSAWNTRENVETRVLSLLSRPILVSNTTNGTVVETGDEGSEMLEFMATNVSEVPRLMLQNFVNSFNTLMNSRLRAYATFLARHGLTLLENSPDSGDILLEEGIVGVEQKLETMLEIGRSVSTNAVATTFEVTKEIGASVKQDDDSETCQVSMPLVMNAAIDISLSTILPDGQHELVTVSFQANGHITGVFLKDGSVGSLLRAVQVDLDMSQLLPSMIKQASSVISCIVDMTNAIYSLSLPVGVDEFDGPAAPLSPVREGVASAKRKKLRAVIVEPDDDPVPIVSPSVCPMGDLEMPRLEEWDLCRETSNNGDGNNCVSLSAENLVDYILYDTDNSVLSPPSKKAKFVSVAGAGPLPEPAEVTQ